MPGKIEPFFVGDEKVRRCLIGGTEPVFIAGPCVIEGEDFTLLCAERLYQIAEKHKIQLVFKASYDKANRTSINSYRGPGLEVGLKILSRVRRDIGLPVLSDVHCREEIPYASEVLDVLQIPAFLARQTDMLVSAGGTGKPINIKKPQFASPYDVQYMIDKVASSGNRKVMICERGTAFGYRDLVVDFRGIPVMRRFAFVIFDGTHTTQKPSAGEGVSDGERWFSPYLTRAAAAVGVDGFFHEVHPEPNKALSDSKTSIDFETFERIVIQVKRILETLHDEVI